MALAVHIRREILASVLGHARSSPEIECCGLLAGSGDLMTEFLPATNALASPIAYEIAPEELFHLFRRMRQNGLAFLGIYHSHTASENVPSPTDLQRAFYPDAAYFIVSPRPETPRPVRAFAIRGGRAEELEIRQVFAHGCSIRSLSV